jgi:Na+/proline symporter
MHKEGEAMGFRGSTYTDIQNKTFLIIVSIFLLILVIKGYTEVVEASSDGAILNTSKPLRIGFDPNLPPFQYTENDTYIRD